VRRPRSPLLTTALGLALGLVVGLVALLAQVAQAGPAAPSVVFTVGRPATASPIPPGFLGLSLEYFAIPAYAGTDPQNVDPVFVQLIRNLAAGAPPELRIGGDTTDLTWWPIPGMRTPAGVNQTLTADWVAVARALATATGARLTLGINLEADSATVASTEADQLAAGLGRNHIESFELGNEPELYGTFAWGHSGKPGRPRDYDFAAFSRDYTRIARALGDVPLAGPATGGPRWFSHIGRFLKEHRDVAVATVHRYPLESCYVKRHDPTYPTIPHLLSAASTQELATSVAGAASQAHAHHVPIRVDEINTVSCGWDPATGRSFASALWALQTLFDLADVGVDGVNIHTFPGATYELFRFGDTDGRWHGTVFPEYYGLDLFAQAAPAGSRLLTVSPSETGTNGDVQAFATRATDGTIRVVVINEGAGERNIDVRARTPPTTATTGTLELLTAPSLGARSGVTLAGQSFGQSTTTGLLSSVRKTIALARRHGVYTLRVPPATAAMLTIG
jgi:hypothetical protein